MNKRNTVFAGLAAAAAVAVGAAFALHATETRSSAPSEALDRYYGQTLTWQPCHEPDLDQAGAQCTDVTVPLDYRKPRGQTITVAISRIPATDPKLRHGVILSNPGGPGGPGLDYMVGVGKAMTPDVRARYDLIGMDPRGVGRSAAVNCQWPTGFGLQSAGIDAAKYAESVATQSDLARRCAAAEGDRLPYFTTRNTARDMDVIRGALGEQRISYMGTSYGTYLGAVFTQMFPERSDRIVLDSAVDPIRYGAVDMVQDMGAANEAALDKWADWTALRDSEYHLGTTREQVRGAVVNLIHRAAAQPIRVGDNTVDDHLLPMLLFMRLDDQRRFDTVAALVRTLADAADGRAIQPDPNLKDVLDVFVRAQPRDKSEQMAIMCGDVGVPRDPAWYWADIEASRATEPVFGAFADNITPCAFWAPPIESPTVVHNSVPALIIQSTGDTRTTYANAQGMHRALTASRLVTLENVAIHSIFDRWPNACVDAAVNTYFRDGTLPAADQSCRDDG
ncbi:alpha/beta hydrolase [Nocardia sp. NPDC088792]|uniref:alpha/beta hydrolase n=1 Tax=Nocardia sp. NPDC088792 TaxID=3364332 RepID=UPI003819F1F9